MQKNAHEQAWTDNATWQFFKVYWRRSVVGFLLGAVLGFAAATVKQVAAQLVGSALKIISHLGVTVWPKHGKVTLFAILAAAAFFYSIRLVQFLVKFWRSGGPVSCRESRSFGFSVLGSLRVPESNGDVSLLALLGIGLLGTTFVWYRDARIGKVGGDAGRSRQVNYTADESVRLEDRNSRAELVEKCTVGCVATSGGHALLRGNLMKRSSSSRGS